MVLKVNSLSSSHGDMRVLSNISFQLEQGKFLAICGKSGVGKTTLLNVIADLHPYSGEIIKKGKLSFVFQDPLLLPWLSTRENIEFAISPKDKLPSRTFLKLIDLEHKEDDYPHQLSGGEKQKVAFARALATEPDILLLDEPFANLDYLSKLEMQSWLNSILSNRKTSVILVTHDLDEAIYLADEVLVLRKNSPASKLLIPLERPRSAEIRYLREFTSLKQKLVDLV